MRHIYLDHTATTPLDPRVLEAMQPYFTDTFANASSVHWYGRQAKSALERAREVIAKAIGAQSGEVFFTSGGTESNNFAMQGAAGSMQGKGKTHIITSAAEHHAVLEPCEHLGKHGFNVDVLPVDQHGIVEPDTIKKALTPETFLVSIMHANNEVGSISPVAEIATLAHESGALMHTDAVQSFGKVPVNVEELGVDLMTLSAHKMYGPKGIGALYIKRGTEINPLLFGGGQERGKRPGTENIPLAVGFARAVELAMNAMADEAIRLRRLSDLLQEKVTASIPAAILNGHPSHRLPHVLNISFDSTLLPIEGEMLLMNMDLHGIAVTSGSACTSGSMQPSHVLLAMGRDGKTAKATLRFAFGRNNAVEDVEYVMASLKEVLAQMSKAS